MSIAIEARGVCTGYGDVTVVRDLDLSVGEGEVVALLGRNGAGKTTSLLTLAGAMRPSAGEIRFRGAADTGTLQDRARRGLGLMTDDRSVFFSLSVRDNLRLGRGSEAAALTLFPELEPLLGRPAGLLSGGQQQMLGLARVLAAEPRVLLIDELSLGLAPVVVGRLLRAVRTVADRGTGVLLVEQYARLVFGVADRASMLVNGRVELEGTVDELQSNLAEVERAYLAAPS
ncbi:MAG: putative high-affinity branched-chain amino acid transport protein superfamily, atp bind [Conexibacter sp.]|nr:putative high-affinity branched-chain amino acid transport protein superfamily, atp bind [Conexibacter sp.]